MTLGHPRSRGTASHSPQRPLRAFISYAREDVDHLRHLEKHLAPLSREGSLAPWHDRMIVAGVERDAAIANKISESDIVLVLISADFIASDRCFEAELNAALIRKETGNAQVVAILVKPVDFSFTKVAHLHILPLGAEPISAWSNVDQAWLSVAKSIRQLVLQMRASLNSAQSSKMTLDSEILTNSRVDLIASFRFPDDWINKLANLLNASTQQSSDELDRISDTFGDPVELAKYYVEPHCQQFNPADDDEEDNRHVVREAIFNRLQAFLGGRADSSGNQLFVLADAGMGKTSLLLMLKLGHVFGLWPPGLDCVLIKLGHDSLKEIRGVDNRRNTILLLDALDEDASAWGSISTRLAELLEATTSFRRVIITCRTQFFSAGEDPFNRRGRVEVAGFLCSAIYLSLFNDEQVDEYCQRRVPHAIDAGSQVKAMLGQMRSLRCRPMLLAHVEDLLASEQQDWTEYSIYDALTRAWLLREHRKLRILHKQKAPSINDLLNASYAVALALQRKGQRRLSVDELAELVRGNTVTKSLYALDIGGRSLLNKNSSGEFRFSHYSFQEFLLTHGVATGSIRAKPPIRVTDQILSFILSWLKSAPKEAREKATMYSLDLSQARLPYIDLAFSNFQSTRLSGANLQVCNLKSACLEQADLRGADLSSATLDHAIAVNANFESAILQGASMRSAKLNNSIFRSSRLQGIEAENSHFELADMTGAQLTGAILYNANLTSANLTSANLQNANLQNANLTDTNLNDANLAGAVLTGCMIMGPIQRSFMKGVTLDFARWPDADLRGFDLEGARMNGAHFDRGTFQGANLSHAHLEKTRLVGAKMQCVNLAGGNLLGTDLCEADLSGAVLDGATLEEADVRGSILADASLNGCRLWGVCYDDKTIWPDRFDYHLAGAIKIDEPLAVGGKMGDLLALTRRKIQGRFMSLWRRASKSIRQEIVNWSETEGVDYAIEKAERRLAGSAEAKARPRKT